MDYEYREKLISITEARDTGRVKLNEWETSLIENIYDNFHLTGNQKSRVDNIYDRIDDES